MTISFDDLTDIQKLQAADLIQKIYAIDAAKSVVQSERATAEIAWNNRINTLDTERMKLEVALRALRAVKII